MSDLTTLIEAVAAAWWDSTHPGDPWAELTPIRQHGVREAVLSVVAIARPLIAAEALREAADEWQQGAWASDLPPRRAGRPQIILSVAQCATDWLRARADRIERGEPG